MPASQEMGGTFCRKLWPPPKAEEMITRLREQQEEAWRGQNSVASREQTLCTEGEAERRKAEARAQG